MKSASSFAYFPFPGDFFFLVFPELKAAIRFSHAANSD
jgi:hypothetical protein